MGMETWPGDCISVASVPRQACVPFITYATKCIRVYTSGCDLNYKDYSVLDAYIYVSMRLYLWNFIALESLYLTWKMKIFGFMWSFGHWEASANMLMISLRSTP